MTVEAPWDILELAENGFKDLTVTAFEQGKMTISPRDGRPSKEINVVRLTVPVGEKPTPPNYWDVTAQLVIPTLGALLSDPSHLPKRIRITKVGTGPSSRLTVTDLGS